ncbi:DUF1501 domain-containing protein [Colwelliaceae bacterium MEBiC 14330]
MLKNKKRFNAQADLSRRHFVKMACAGTAMLSFPMSSAFAGSAGVTSAAVDKAPAKIIWVVLRGAVDSLHTIIPTFDKHYAQLRPKLSNSFKSELLPLEKGFALHPSLVNLHQWYQEESLLPIVAVSSGYAKRSHFDGQDFLETGKGEIDHDSGWLARAIEAKGINALAVSRSIPISLRSNSINADKVNTWYPSKHNNADEDLYAALGNLYQHDEALNNTLASALEVKNLVGVDGQTKRKGKFKDLANSCAKLMSSEQGIDCAMLELGGWDTHNNQSPRLARKFNELDDGLAQLRVGLGDHWQNTVVIIGTEFGRTARENGTGGTDHGTASALLLAGGAVNGGKVKGRWPGLKTEQLFEQRDLMPTSNSFGWLATILSQHWQLSEQALKQVFPQIKPYDEELIRS